MNTALLVLATLYGCLVFYFCMGILRLYHKRPFEKLSPLPRLSVIVPLRNEAKQAQKTLDCLAAQNYRGQWEVILVDDRSTDSTLDLIKNQCSQNPRFKWIRIEEDKPHHSPKKQALEKGIALSQGDILLTTDADCLPGPDWLQSMASNFGESIGIVQGPKEILGEKNWLTRYQQLETLAFVGIEAATFAMGKPLLASAPCLAYRKSLYQKAGGFTGQEHLISGDDDMLVHKMSKLPGARVRYNFEMAATVKTPAAKSWTAVLAQRSRWSSNGLKYESKSFVALLIGIYAFYSWLFLGPLAALTGLVDWAPVFLSHLLKYGVDFSFLKFVGLKFHFRFSIVEFLFAQWTHLPITVFAVFRGQIGWFQWR